LTIIPNVSTIPIQIAGTTIQFPSTGQSPIWSPAVIQFAQAVSAALAGIVGPADVAPQTLVLDPYNPGSDIIIPNLTFSTTTVRAAFIRYAVYRQTTTQNGSEAGTLTIVYNPNNPINNKWEYDRTYVGNAQVQFSISDQGSVQISTIGFTGIDHVGSLSYVAQALLQVE
jgi:hypothetical protein